jgi:hypothetical protein
VYSALLALEAEELHPTHLAWLASHGMLVYRVAEGATNGPMQDKAVSLLSLCAGIRDRAAREGADLVDVPLEVNAKEEIKLRAILWETLPWLRAQSNQAVFGAVAAALASLDAGSGASSFSANTAG